MKFWEKKDEFLFAKGGMEWCADVGSDSVGAGQHMGRHHAWVVGESAHVSSTTVRIGSYCGCNTHRSRVHVHHRRRCHARWHERQRGWSRIGNEHRLRRRRSWTCQLVHGRSVAPRFACQREVVNVYIQSANVAPSPSRVGSPHSLQSRHKGNYRHNLQRIHVHTHTHTANRIKISILGEQTRSHTKCVWARERERARFISSDLYSTLPKMTRKTNVDCEKNTTQRRQKRCRSKVLSWNTI